MWFIVKISFVKKRTVLTSTITSTTILLRCFIFLKFSKSVRKKCDEYPSARVSKLEQLNAFNIFVLFTLAPLLLYFFNHVLVFFVALFEFSLRFLTSVYSVTLDHFRMGRGQFYRSFIIKVDYLIYYTE